MKKILTLLNESNSIPSKFMIRNQMEINYLYDSIFANSKTFEFTDDIFRASLCNCGDACMVAERKIMFYFYRLFIILLK